MKMKYIRFAPLFLALVLTNARAGTILNDSFDSGLSNWTAQSGDWSILPNGSLKGAWSFSAAYSQQGVLRLDSSFQPAGDFVASVDFTRISNAGYYFPGLDPAFSAAATFGFIQSDGRRLDIGLQGPATVSNQLSGPQTSIYAFAQVYNGPGPYQQPFATPYGINWDPNAWNTFNLSRVGSLYTIGLNGTELTSFNDTIFNGAGALSLKTYGVSNFDNFKLSSGASPVPEAGSTLWLLVPLLVGFVFWQGRRPIILARG